MLNFFLCIVAMAGILLCAGVVQEVLCGGLVPLKKSWPDITAGMLCAYVLQYFFP